MKLKYVGPKPVISHTGIEFDNNKEDKYVYLNIVIQLLKSLNNNYIKDKVYTYDSDMSRLSESEVTQQLREYCPDIDKFIEIQELKTKEEVEHNLQRAHENKILSNEDKETLINNLKIMSDYVVQRAINKSVYYCAIDKLADMVKEDHIDYIVVPMFQKFAHVLHSVQGSLIKQKMPIDTKLEIFQEDNKLLTKLKVINN